MVIPNWHAGSDISKGLKKAAYTGEGNLRVQQECTEADHQHVYLSYNW